MATNKIIEKMRAGEKALGLHLNFYSEDLIEIAGLMGLDLVNYDGQHGPVTPETIDSLCRLCDAYGLTPAMRVPDQIPSNILNYLDRGVRAITVPDLETKEQAEALVQACFFGPIGRRSYTGPRMTRYGLTEPKAMMEEANDTFLLMPQIESITAYRNLEEILTVPQIEVFTGGPNDLAQSMGHPGEPDHPECLRVTEEGQAKIRAAGKKVASDVMESVAAAATVQDAMAALLKQHGR